MPHLSPALLGPLASLILASAGAASAQSACSAPAPRQFADEGGPHLAECSALSPSHYPPTSGPHFPVWADPGTYKAVINPGYWLHSAEHGAVIFLINCRRDPDCPADFDRLEAIADAFPADPACDAQDRHRIIISGDTSITTRFAAVAWNWSLETDCLDSVVFARFLADHYARAPEDICGYGTTFPGTGWCNAPLSLAPPQARGRGKVRAASAARVSTWPGLPEDRRPDGRKYPRPGKSAGFALRP